MTAQESAPDEVGYYLQRRVYLRKQLGDLAEQGAEIRRLTSECLEEMIQVNGWLKYCDVDTSGIDNPPAAEAGSPEALRLVEPVDC